MSILAAEMCLERESDRSKQEEAMYTETMIARTEYQLMQFEVAQLHTRDGVVVEDEHAQRGAGLIHAIRSLFAQQRTRVRREANRAIQTAVR
jgi:hypothetical protein